MRRRPCISGARKRRFSVPSVAERGREAANSGIYGLRQAASSTSARPVAVIRSLRDSPEPFSITRSGIVISRRARKSSMASRLAVVVAGRSG